MSDVPRETLIRIITKYGASVCADPRRCEALLRDLCGAYRREINILTGALEERVAHDLMNAGKTLPREALLARLTKRLQDQLAYTEDAAQWAVDSWALALGVISSREAGDRAKAAQTKKQQGEEPRAASPRASAPGAGKPHDLGSADNLHPEVAKPATPKPTPPKPTYKSPPPSVPNSPTPPVPQPAPPHTTGSTPRHQTASPFRAQPSPTPPTSPPLRSSPTSHVRPSLSTAPVAQPSPPLAVQPRRSWMGKLRGCLLIFLLVVGLIVLAAFAVPAIITLLRQEQLQPSINEPRVPRSN